MSKPIATNKRECPWCHKTAVEKSRVKIGQKLLISLECSHTVIRDAIETEEVEIVSRDGKRPYPYQIKSAEFFEKADLTGICAHEMGVGKTVVECLLLRRNWDALTQDDGKILIVCKSGLRYQWFLEVIRWTGKIPQIVDGSRDMPQFDFFDIFIVSFDTLRLLRPDTDREYEMWQAAGFGGEEDTVFVSKKGKKKKIPKIIWPDELCAQFSHICIDECQMMKNPDASRTRALKKIASAWERVGKTRVPRIMGLSGTPIKNDASEYATILHLVRPEMFPSEIGFIAHHCRPIGSRFALRDAEHFHDLTKDFILRYTRDEVLPELPKIFRQFRYIELEGGDLEAYKRAVKEFQDYCDELEDISARDITNILGFFSKMRRITGVAKVKGVLDFVEEFLLSNNRKLVIFVHHKDCGAMLYSALSKLCQEAALDEPLMLTSELNMMQRQEIVSDFKGVRTVSKMVDGQQVIEEVPIGKNHRIMIASTLAAGEGLNLQFCSDCVIMERQWNPANEEQAEARFPRPGSTADKVNVTYAIAAGTMDDFLTEVVERKRSIVKNTLDGTNEPWDESSLMMELANILRVKGLKKWQV
jgi:SNF2 family DNA or RNA helicase